MAASAIPTRSACAACARRSPRIIDEHYGVAVTPERIAVTTGSSAAFNLAFLAMFDVGDRVAVAAPGYPAYRNILATLGIEVVEIETVGSGHLTAAHLAAAHAEKPLKGVLFASPANPTGAIIPAADLEELVATARELGIAAISDEIYHRLAYAAPDVTALSLSDDVVGHQLVLEILLHDRLADRLDGAAGSLGASGRAHPAEPLHFAAGAVADRGDRGFHGNRRAGGGEGALRHEPRIADAAAAGDRVPARRADGRRLLRLLRCFRPHQ